MAAPGLAMSPMVWSAREIERVDSGYRSAMSVQNSLVMHPIEAYGSEAQRSKYLPKLATGEMVGCFGLTEARCRLRSRRHEDEGQANAQAGSCSTARRCGSPIRRSPMSRWCGRSSRTRAFTASSSSAARRASRRPKIEGKFSLRASVTGEIVLDNVEVPEDSLLPGAKGLARPLRLPQQGALRHCLGRHGGGGGLLAPGADNIRSTASSSAGRSPPTS